MVKPTDRPLWQAARPRLSATWVLSLPLFLTAMTFSRWSTYSHRASWMTRCLFTDGMARKPTVNWLRAAKWSSCASSASRRNASAEEGAALAAPSSFR